VTDEYTVTVRREIEATAEELFDAWLDQESLGQWFKAGTATETRAEIDPRVGGGFRIVMLDAEDDFVHIGTYREIERPRRLVFTWSSKATHHRDSIVTVTFEPSASSTVVEIHQVGLPDEQARASHTAGWSDILRLLAQHKETTT
jgi:uncharacterized protein YndB with AHSA1/START domain